MLILLTTLLGKRETLLFLKAKLIGLNKLLSLHVHLIFITIIFNMFQFLVRNF